MLTFSSAWIIGTVNMINKSNEISHNLINGAALSLPIFAISALLSLYSFIPRSNFFQTKKKSAKSNLLYFGDVASTSDVEYEEALKNSYLPEAGRSITDPFISDMASQVFTYSSIANRKFRIFNISARICLAAVSILVAFACAWAWNHAGLTTHFTR